MAILLASEGETRYRIQRMGSLEDFVVEEGKLRAEGSLSKMPGSPHPRQDEAFQVKFPT
jgi:hypothetical protein